MSVSNSWGELKTKPESYPKFNPKTHAKHLGSQKRHDNRLCALYACMVRAWYPNPDGVPYMRYKWI